jgi:hypothetical protein
LKSLNSGGGEQINPDPPLDLDSIPLQWMKIQAEGAELRFDDSRQIHLDDQKFRGQAPTKSLRSWWWVPQILCFSKPRRTFREGQRIHFSVAFKGHEPIVKAPDQRSWSTLDPSTLLTRTSWADFLDLDLFSTRYTLSLVTSLKIGGVKRDLLSQLRLVTSTGKLSLIF